MTSQNTAPRTGFKPVDILGLLYFIAVSLGLYFYSGQIGSLTHSHPAPMYFAKFFLLASFGECLKTRLSSGSWIPHRLWLRAPVWGLFGVWIGAGFVLADDGVTGLVAKGLWMDGLRPFSISLWSNFLSGYAFFMMFTHYWVDHLIEGEMIWPWELMGRPATTGWAKVVFISLAAFWLWAHTITFNLPPSFRVVFAAYLSVALGLILAFAGRR